MAQLECRVTPHTFALISDRHLSGHLSITANNAVAVTLPNEQLAFDEPYIASHRLIKADTSLENSSLVGHSDPKNYTVSNWRHVFF
jgi:hypothetical protein